MEKTLEPTEVQEPKKKSLINPKVFIIGLPVFIVQLVLVYFVTANILLSKIEKTKDTKTTKTEDAKENSEAKPEESKKSVELGKHIFNLSDDIIINPSGTSGTKLLLANVGFDLGSEEHVLNLKAKEVLVKDIVISVLSSKTVNQLSNIGYRDTLKAEINKNILESIPKTKINSIYFSKYLMQ